MKHSVEGLYTICMRVLDLYELIFFVQTALNFVVYRYCAKLIHGWGGRLGTLAGTDEGLRLMQELDQIDINDVRFLIKRLIKGGYDKKIPIRPSEQEILTSLEISFSIVDHLALVREGVHAAKLNLQLETAFVQESILDLCSTLNPIFAISKSMDDDLYAEYNGLFRSGPAISKAMGRHSHNQDFDDFDDLYQAIDSDEEAKLFEELDALMEAQERAFLFKGNAHELMAQTFQKVTRRLVELETAYDLVRLRLAIAKFRTQHCSWDCLSIDLCVSRYANVLRAKIATRRLFMLHSKTAPSRQARFRADPHLRTRSANP